MLKNEPAKTWQRAEANASDFLITHDVVLRLTLTFDLLTSKSGKFHLYPQHTFINVNVVKFLEWFMKYLVWDAHGHGWRDGLKNMMPAAPFYWCKLMKQMN